MANVQLKSIKFPNLSDTYTIPQTAGDISYDGDGVYASGTVGKGIQDVETNMATTLESYAKIDGSYDNLTAGNAKQLVSTVRANDKVPYNFRTSGGSVDIGDREYINAITGGSLAWNQLHPKRTTSYTSRGITVSDTSANGAITVTGERDSTGWLTLADVPYVANHKMLMVASKLIVGATNTVGFAVLANYTQHASLTVAKPYAFYTSTENKTMRFAVGGEVGDIADISSIPQAFDLTLLFGSTIADYIYSLETNHAGDGVAWFKKLFPKPYYAYDSGSIQSVKTSKHKTVGFNAWDEEWESGAYDTNTGAKTSYTGRIRNKNLIPILPSTTYYAKAPSNTAVYWKCFYDANGDFIKTIGSNSNATFTSPTDAYYMAFYTESSYGSETYNHDICINLSWDGSRNGEYEPYSAHEYALDSDLTLRGIPKLDANNSLYYDGDTYESDGTVTRKYGVVDLGTLTWSYASDTAYPRFIAQLSDIKSGSSSVVSNIVCSKYKATYTNDIYSNGADKSIGVNTTYLWIRDSAYTDAVTFKTAMSGVYLVYELATPTTETADPFQSPQICDDFGTEEYVDTRDVAIPVGHDTDYPVSLVAKLEMAPDSPNQGNGDYIVRQTNGENAYVPLVIEDALPTMPSTAGEYRLIVTIADGEDPVLSWEAQE